MHLKKLAVEIESKTNGTGATVTWGDRHEKACPDSCSDSCSDDLRECCRCRHHGVLAYGERTQRVGHFLWGSGGLRTMACHRRNWKLQRICHHYHRATHE